MIRHTTTALTELEGFAARHRGSPVRASLDIPVIRAAGRSRRQTSPQAGSLGTCRICRYTRICMRLPLGLVKRVLAGIVFGIYTAYLLYFLNPQLAISPARIALACLVYGVIGGILFGAVLWLARAIRIRLLGKEGLPARRQGFGLVSLSVFFAALVYWYHLIVFRIYLPIGAVRVLSKATTLVAATAFVLFILWLFDRGADARRSRTILLIGCAVIALCSVLLYQRREGYRSHARDVVYAELVTSGAARSITAVAVRGLPLDWLIRAEGEGIVPFLHESNQIGYRTRLEPYRSSSPKSLWASLATGQLPSRHGVTGRFSYRTLLSAQGESFSLLPSGIGFRGWGLIPPVERLSAPIPAGVSVAFWEAFQKAGRRSAVINWEGARPDTTDAAIIVSDHWIEQTPDRPHAFRPHEIRDTLTAVAGEAAVPASIRLRLAPIAPSVRERVFSAMLHDIRAAHSALRVGREGELPLRVVAFNGFAETLEAIGGAPDEIPEAGTPEGIIVRAHLQLIDQLLNELANTGEMFTVFSPGASSPPPIPASPAAIVELIDEYARPGARDGFFLLRGQSIRPRTNPHSARMVDVAPTLLFVGGLPIARDMDGSILIEAFAEERLSGRSVSFIPSYGARRLVISR